MRAMSRRAFSLIELVIVVVIIGIIAAIAIPRMSRGATGAAENSLKANLSLLRNAVEIFQTENGGNYPTVGNLPNALTGYSDGNGGVVAYAATRPGGYPYGPYLRDIPKVGVGTNKDSNTFTDTVGTAGAGWVYKDNEIKANAGAPYNGW
jgi:general secretion pathway protein G